MLGEPICHPSSFRDEARYQRVCAACGRPANGCLAHHVLYEQNLRRLGLRGTKLYDTRNALRLCLRCHTQHHHAMQRVKVTSLLDQNLEYVFEKLGYDRGVDYLVRYYDNDPPDPRLEQAAAA